MPDLDRIAQHLDDLAELEQAFAADPTRVAYAARHAAAVTCARDARELYEYARLVQPLVDELRDRLVRSEADRARLFADLQHAKSLNAITRRAA